jgi:4,5-DOPA dioxygenase extradiol
MDQKMPALYIGHGAPPLLEDPIWGGELANWSEGLPKPKAILIVSAHWESAPLTIGATETVPLIYDFGGFAPKYYNIEYRAPGAPDLATRIKALMGEHVAEQPNRGLDHGA